MRKIDWSKFNEFPESTCYCTCGAKYRSHAKVVVEGEITIVSRKPCPNCHRDRKHLRKMSSDPEVMTVKSRR